MLTADDLEGLALALAGDSTGNGVFRAIAAIATDRLGCLVFSASKARPGSMEVERVYSSDPETYPPGITTNKRETQWGRHVLMQGKVFVGEGTLAMAAAFDDKEGMGRAGVQSIINVPILLGEQCVGVLNFGFAADRIEANAVTTARCLGLAATAAFALAVGADAKLRMATQEPAGSAPVPLLRAIGAALDGLGVGTCAFDEQDRALVWNREFLRLFPEHAGKIHVGEPYRANLRRFYEGRLTGEELSSIDRYIEEGLARHRQQQRPFDFEHRGMRMRVASIPLPGVGRIRIWRQEAESPSARGDATTLALPGRAGKDDTDLLLYLAEGLTLTDADDRIVWTNGTFLSLYGFEVASDVQGRGFDEVYQAAWKTHSGGERERYESGLAVLRENLRFVGAPFEVPLPGMRWARVTQQRRPDGSGCSTHVDISELKRRQDELHAAEQQARSSQALLEATLERMQQGIMMVNAERVVEVCNKRAMELLDLPESLMESKPRFDDVLAYQWSTDEFRRSSQTVQEFVRAGGILDEPQTYDRERPNGRIIEVQSVPIAGGGVLRTYTDITERKRHEERIQHIARHDGLTALVNRGAFLEQLSEEMQRVAVGEERRFAVHYVDLDRFKPINDEHGHAIGDEVLSIVSKRMRSIARETDVVARMGGDEFAILQRGTDDNATALGLARRMLADIRQPLRVESLRLQVGASIGIALFPGGAEDADTLLRHADLAMYAAKAAGRDCVRIYESPTASGQ